MKRKLRTASQPCLTAKYYYLERLLKIDLFIKDVALFLHLYLQPYFLIIVNFFQYSWPSQMVLFQLRFCDLNSWQAYLKNIFTNLFLSRSKVFYIIYNFFMKSENWMLETKLKIIFFIKLSFEVPLKNCVSENDFSAFNSLNYQRTLKLLENLRPFNKIRRFSQLQHFSSPSLDII